MPFGFSELFCWPSALVCVGGKFELCLPELKQYYWPSNLVFALGVWGRLVTVALYFAVPDAFYTGLITIARCLAVLGPFY